MDKGAATRAWASALRRGMAPAQAAVAALAYAQSVAGKDPHYIKNPATWLNAESYDNQTAPAALSSVPYYRTFTTRGAEDPAAVLDGFVLGRVV